jgi:hypothetical protein
MRNILEEEPQERANDGSATNAQSGQKYMFHRMSFLSGFGQGPKKVYAFFGYMFILAQMPPVCKDI